MPAQQHREYDDRHQKQRRAGGDRRPVLTAFAVLLTSGNAQTAPPFIPIIIGEGGQDWPAVAAGTTLFLVPIVVFTVLLRKHLLRGITFGAVRK